MVQIYEQKISCSGVTKTVRVCCGDICESHESYDVLFCSAFRGNYYPLPYTLIGSLFYKLGIPVEILAKKPFLDLKSMGCWMSDGLPGPFKRIGCVEILSLGHDHMYADLSDVMLKSVFSTFRFLLEQASYRGVCVKRVALPLLGSGSQQIEKEYIVVPMISQSLAALREIDSFEELTFFDLNLEKAQYLADCLEKSLKMLSTNSLSCFVSYSSKQEDFAQEFFSFLQRNNLSCWMAPNSIPSGSDYLEVIPSALNQISVLALLLTPDAAASPWVQKEVATAIGARKIVLPFQITNFEITPKFRFLLDGEQIFPAWRYDRSVLFETMLSELKTKMNDAKR